MGKPYEHQLIVRIVKDRPGFYLVNCFYDTEPGSDDFAGSMGMGHRIPADELKNIGAIDFVFRIMRKAFKNAILRESEGDSEPEMKPIETIKPEPTGNFLLDEILGKASEAYASQLEKLRQDMEALIKKQEGKDA